MSTKIQVAADFKGELSLPFLRTTTLTANNVITISDNDFNSRELKVAIDRGLVTVVPTKSIKIEKEVPVAEEPVEDEEVEDEEVEDEEVVTHGVVDVTKEAESQSPSTVMSSWDPQNKEMLPSMESNRKAMGQLNSKQADDIQATKTQVGEIDFVSPVPKPTAVKKATAKKKPTFKSKKGISTKDALKNAARKIAKTVQSERKSIKPTGTQRILPTADDADALDFVPLSRPARSDDLGFVDQEQEEARIQKHPILAKKINAEMNEEVK